MDLTSLCAAVDGKFCIYDRGGAPAGMTSHPLCAGWSIAIDSSLRMAQVVNRGRVTGWLLGVPVDLEQKLVVGETLEIDVQPQGEVAWQTLCNRCAGSWLYLARHDGGIELRPDADASIGAVYDPLARRIASHAFLLTGEDYHSRLQESQRRTNQVERDGWFTGGLTAHSGIFRLLPNHRLSTSDFVPSRLALDLPAYVEDCEPLIDAIACEVASVVEALGKAGKAQVCLTGGHETRALLAALRDQAGLQQFVTFAFPASTLDVHIARQLSQSVGLRHAVLPHVQSDERGKDLWRYAAGHSMTGANLDNYLSTGVLAGQFLVGGLGGEVGRGFLWPTNLAGGDVITPRTILDRLKLPGSTENLAAVAAWHHELPAGLDAFQVLDLAYLELRMGPWAFAQPRMHETPFVLHPLISYPQFRRMWSVPPALRAEDALVETLTRRRWGDLLQVPVNRYGDWRDAWFRASRALQRPDRVVRKVRQMLAPRPRGSRPQVR